MPVGFHPVVDNPIRMGYVPGWGSIGELIERLGDLEHAIGECRVIPAHWEPFYKECPCCRYGAAYTWARTQLQDPDQVALALALFPGEEEQPATRIGRANWLILCTKGEPSNITRKIMLAEALELWELHAPDWLQKIVETCASLGVATSVSLLQAQVEQALRPLAKALPEDDVADDLPNVGSGSSKGHGFDKDLLQMDGWTPNPGLVILPVDGRAYSLAREILLLDISQVVLLRARKAVRSLPWEKITLIHVREGAVTFEVIDEPAMVVAGYKHPADILKTVQECYKAATERILQGLAARMSRPVP